MNKMNIMNITKRKYIGIAATLVITGATLSLTGSRMIDTFAVNQSDINDAEQEVQATQQKIDELNSQLDKLGNDIVSVEAYVSALDSQINTIASNMSYYKNLITIKQNEIDMKNLEIVAKQQEIDVAEIKLKDASETEASQYEMMKKRIQYMYECGDNTFLEMIFNADNLADMLGKTEYVSSIVSYDRKQLEKLKEIHQMVDDLLVQLQSDKSELEVEKTALEAQKTELVALEADLETQQSLVNSALEVKEATLKKLESEQKYAEYERQLEQAKLEAQKREAAELKRKWEEEVAKAQAQGQNADEANKKKLEEIGLAGGFEWPLPGFNWIISYFGPRTDPFLGIYTNHSGIDITGSNVYGQPVHACYSGTVSVVDIYTPSDTMSSKPYGTSIQIDHGAGVVTLYAHLSGVNVSVGQTVNAGDIIGFVGSTGKSQGAHLHLTLYIKGVLSDPLPYLKQPT